MAAMVGLDRDSKPLKASFSLASFFSTTLSRMSANSLTSEPAQNAPSPVPVTTTVRTASSASSSSRVSNSCSVIPRVTRLSGGLLRVSFATPPSSRSTSTGAVGQDLIHPHQAEEAGPTKLQKVAATVRLLPAHLPPTIVVPHRVSISPPYRMLARLVESIGKSGYTVKRS